MPDPGGNRISVVLPARDEASTVGAICRSILGGLGSLVDELVVIDGGSADDTAREAARAGAIVVHADDVVPSFGPARGKGDSMWRSLAVTTGDIVVWLDADITGFDPRFVTRLCAPLLEDPSIALTKGFYARPLAGEPDGGGRVTELLARPLLAIAFPELGGFLQPLGGEYAGRREVLERVPFFSGYSVEVGLLIDLLEIAGLEAMTQVDLGVRRHRNRSVAELAPTAHAIARSILARAEQHGRLFSMQEELALPLLREGASLVARDLDEVERPPMATLRAPVHGRDG